MIKIVSCLIVVFFCGKFVFAQIPQKVLLIYLPQGHTMEALSGGGNLSASESSISTIGTGNPAALCEFSGILFGGSYQINSKISDAWIADIGYKRTHPYYPQAFGLSYKLDEFTAGFGTSQLYNGTVDYGELLGTIRYENEQGYLEVGKFYPKREDIVIKNSLFLNYNFKKLLNLSSDLCFGFRYNYNYLKSHMEVESDMEFQNDLIYQPQEWEKELFASSYAIGLKYDVFTGSLMYLKLGAFFESQLVFDKLSKIGGNSVRFFGYIPDKLHAGATIGFYNNLILSANSTYYLWEQIEGSNSFNQIELSSNISYLINKDFKATFGFLITDRQYDVEDDVFNMNSSLFVTFLTAGFIYKYNQYEFDFSFADSHLFSDDWRKQSICKIGLGYNLN